MLIYDTIVSVYCNPGQQKTALGCEPCPRGYYKSNVPDVFSMCMMCPIDTITPSLGSDDVSDCYQGMLKLLEQQLDLTQA